MSHPNNPKSLQDGPHNIYYADGSIKVEQGYQNGKLHGPQKMYGRNGELLIEKTFNEGKLYGPARRYRGDGTIDSESEFTEDGQETVRREFHKNGQLKYEMYIKDHKPDKSSTYYNEDGELTHRLDYKDGKLFNDLFASKLEKKKSMEAGRFFYTKDGFYTMSIVVKGQFNGPSKSYYRQDGPVRSSWTFKNDRIDGDYVTYTENGEIIDTKKYVDGVLVQQ